jgi:hypothetical protein
MNIGPTQDIPSDKILGISRRLVAASRKAHPLTLHFSGTRDG